MDLSPSRDLENPETQKRRASSCRFSEWALQPAAPPHPAWWLCRFTWFLLPPSSPPPLPPPPPLCFLFILLWQAALGKKGRSLHTCTPPWVPAAPIPIKCLWLHHCLSLLCSRWPPALPSHRRPGTWAGACGNLKPLLRLLSASPPLFSHCPSCPGGLVAQSSRAVSLVSLEGEQWAGFLLGLPEVSKGNGDVSHLCLPSRPCK